MARQRFRVRGTLLLLAFFLSCLPVATVHAATVDVTNGNDSGGGSLREAINTVNAGNADTITFHFSTGAPIITVGSELPTITKPVTIDATTQGAVVELRGGNVVTRGIVITGNGIVVRGLAINGFTIAGIYATSSSNRFEGNRIGTDSSGARAIPNAVGIYLAGASGNTVGGTTAGTGNVLSGNTIAGLTIDGANGGGNNNVVQGNFVGINAAGTAAIPNTGGIAVTNASGNTIGGLVSGARNVVSGNTQNGVTIDGTTSGASNNTVVGNFVGTDYLGTTPVPNNVGVAIFKASNNTIGGTTAAARNVLSGNANGNLTIVGTNAAATGNIVQGNFIGTDPTGARPVGHCDAGVYILDASSNTIGGTAAGAGNIISGNNLKGINSTGLAIDGSNNSTAFNLVQGNLIGTDITGTVSIPNGVGIYIAAGDNNTIGGLAAGARNLISGNTPGNGVSIDGHRASDGTPKAASGNIIQGNFIGTNLAGTAALPNGVGASITSGSNNLIANNTISGNTQNGVAINVLDGVTPASNNTVQQNFVGTNAAGNAAVANNIGVSITNASSNTIVGNVVSGNTHTGVFINVISPGTAAAFNVVQGNFIGTDSAGKAAIPNGQQGVSIASANNNVIGGDLFANASFSNTIAFNGNFGVVVSSASGDAILGNSISANGGGGISLAGGTGNHNQAAPALSAVTFTGSQLVVSGSLNSTPNATFRVELFANPSTSSNQGKTFLTAASVQTNGGGAGTFSNVAIPFVPAGQFVTATATNAVTNDSSAFSNAVVVPAAPPPTVSAINPHGGPAGGGTSVTITGANFFAGASVTFGGVAASSVTVSSSTQIIAITPSHATGTVDVIVTNADSQRAILRSAFTYVNSLPSGGRPPGSAQGNPAPLPSSGHPSGPSKPGNPNPLPGPR